MGRPPAPHAPPAAPDRRRLDRALTARLGSAAEARWLLDEVLGRGAAGPATAAQVARLEALAAERLAGTPLQYVLGHWAFRRLELAVDPRVLIPRPETEQVVEVALGELRRLLGRRPGPGRAPVAVDLGTGSGAIALSLATEGGELVRAAGAGDRLEVVAADTSPEALAVAADNLAAVGDGTARHAVRLVRGHWWAALPPSLHGGVDLVVSNPPYVAAAELAGLDPEVRAEPVGALVAADGRDGTPGLADIETVVEGAARWLARPGAAVVELAPHQASAAAAVARAAGFDEVRVAPDLAGRPRALVARTGG